MSKVFEVDFRKGSSLNTIANTACTFVTNCKLLQREYGMAAVSDGLGSKVNLGTSFTCLAICTEVLYFKTGVTAGQACLVQGTLHGAGMHIYYNGSNAIFYNSYTTTSVSCSLTATLFPSTNYCLVVIKNGTIVTAYLNGISLVVGSSGATENMVIQSYLDRTGNDLAIKGTAIYYHAIYNHLFTVQEANKAYADFLASKPFAKSKTNFIYPKPTDLSQFKGTGANQGLVAAYNMQPVGGVLVDVSGNGLNGTIVGAPLTYLNGLKFNAVNSKITISYAMNLRADWSFHIRYRFNEVANDVSWGCIFGASASYQGGFLLAARGFLSWDGSLAVGCLSTIAVGLDYNYTLVHTIADKTIKLYSNGVYVNQSTYAGTLPTGITTLYLGDNTNAKERPLIEDLRIYNRAVSLQEIKNYHNQFATQLYLREHFEDLPVDGTTILPRGWIAGTGSYKGGEIAIASGNRIVHPMTVNNGWSSLGSGVYSYINNALGSDLYKTSVVSIGKRYRLRFTVTANPSNTQIRITDGTAILFGYTAYSVGVTELSFNIVSAGTSLFMQVAAGAASGLVISDISLIEIPPLPHIRTGYKYLEDTVAGTIAIPSNWAYGAVEFDWYKGADANYLAFIFCSGSYNLTAVNGYSVTLENTETLKLQKWGATGASANLIASAAAYITNFTWYRVRITRTLAGVWTLLIKGGAFTPTAGYDGWTLVSVAGGSGTNPATDNTYTTSNFLVLDLDAGDRFGGLDFYKGIKQ